MEICSFLTTAPDAEQPVHDGKPPDLPAAGGATFREQPVFPPPTLSAIEIRPRTPFHSSKAAAPRSLTADCA